MAEHKHMNDCIRLGSWSVGCFFLLAGLLAISPDARAGEIQSLDWAPGSEQPTLRIGVAGEAPYQVASLEGGKRLRLRFPDARLGGSVGELRAYKYVKGAFPYLADAGRAVNIDLLLVGPGSVEVRKTELGYDAVVQNAASGRAPETSGAAGDRNEIREIVYAKLPGDRVQIIVRTAKRPPEPQSFSITNPARISLDFPNTRVAMPTKTVPVKQGAVTSVTAIEADGRSRVVLSLIKPVAYTTAIDDSGYVVTLESPTSAIVGTDQPKTTRFASARKGGKFSLKNIDFRRGPQADAKIAIKLSDPAVGVDIREQAGEIVLDFLDTSVSSELQRRLDVVDFATPVQTIDTFAQGRNTRMVITPKGKYEHIAYQTGDVFTVSVKPIIEKPDEKQLDEFGYSGEKLSLNFQNIDVRAALQVLADFTGLNFVVSDTVKGSLTLRLKDVPWDQALDLIVDAKSLAVRRKGNVVVVAPAAEVVAKEKAAFEAAKSAIELEPLVSELIQINYAKAEDIAQLLKSIKPVTDATVQQAPGSSILGATPQASALGPTSTNSLLSPRGQVTIDVRTNSVLVQDTPEKIREIRKLIAQLDQPVRQVLIETRLVEATDNFARGLGVRWGHLSDGHAGSTRVVTNGRLEQLDGYLNSGAFPLSTGLNVNLPSAGAGNNPAAAFAITLQAGSRILDLELSALEQEGRGKIISSPRVITANQKKAKIEQGQERVFTTVTQNQVTVTTKRATLKLEVTPQITPDDRVNLEVDITKDNFADAEQGLLNVKQINTQVLLDNGETVVIGGIFEQDSNNTTAQVPFFGDLPLVGWLFKKQDVRDNKTELLIFLTPRIVTEGLALR